MSMSKNIARLAVTAGLTAALSFGGVMAPVTMAFAAEGDQGSITINKVVDKNATNKFKAYQIFKAKVVDEKDKGKVASDIEWANDDIDSKVIAAIKNSTQYQELVTKDSAKALADDAAAPVVAEWLSQNVIGTSASSADSSDGTRVAPGDVLYSIARAVTLDESAVGNPFTQGELWTRPNANGDGYYLFVSDGLTDTNQPNTGTSPIFAIVGGKSVTVTEKTSIPTVEKKVLDDSKVTGGAITGEKEANWKDAADSQIGQEVNYRLTGTIADNYASYDSYSYKFTDNLTKGLDYVAGQTKVYAVNKDSSNKDTYIDISSYFDVRSIINADKTTTLTVEAKPGENGKHLKEISDVNANTKIVVFYKAKLNSSAVIAGANGMSNGNPNTVTLEYSNNPMSNDAGTSAPDTVEDYTYGLKINKVDLGTEAPLVGAEFTITTKGDEKNAKEKYVAKDGTLSDTEFVHTTGDDGSICLTGLDAGTYTVTEKNAPKGYTAVSSFEFTINPTIKDDGQGYRLTNLEGKLDSKGQNDKVIDGLTDKKSGDYKLTKTDESEKNADGTFNITVGDYKQVGLPLTGLNGVTFTWIAGGAVLCIGVAHLIRSRKQAEESEQE